MPDARELLDDYEWRGGSGRPKAFEALRAVLELHRPLSQNAFAAIPVEDPVDVCSLDTTTTYPCATVRAISKALERSMTDYDGRISEACKDECQEGTCSHGGLYTNACGGCCGCLGGCVLGWNEQQESSYVKVERCTCNAVFCGPGSGHESDCGWVET